MSEKNAATPDETTPPAAADDVHFGIILRFGVGMVLSLTLVSALLFAYMRELEKKTGPLAASPGMESPERGRAKDPFGAEVTLPDGSVRLQEQPFKDIEDLRKAETLQLESYGVVDEASGTVHIRIEDAMDLVVQRGLPVRPPAAVEPTPVATPEATPAASPRKKQAAPPAPKAHE